LQFLILLLLFKNLLRVLTLRYRQAGSYLHEMFDFRLQVFQAVARRLSFTKAGEELFITQPAVTKHIHELESHFKQKLFERNGNKTTLTPAGRALIKHTEELFAIYRNIELDLNDIAKKHSGKLRLGASTTVGQYVIPPVVAAFHQKYNTVKVNLKTDNTEEIEHALLKGNIDLGIIEGHTKNKSIQYVPFLKDEIVLVAGIPYRDFKKDTIRPEELTKTPLLLREHGSGTLEVIAIALKKIGIKMSALNIEMHLNSTEAIKAYLMHSPCMAFISIHAVHKELEHHEFRIIKVNGLTIERPFYFIMAQGDNHSLAELFMRFAKQYNLK
jgi:LysR family transcriptional regulator, transcriptional activator of the cysJI operon